MEIQMRLRPTGAKVFVRWNPKRQRFQSRREYGTPYVLVKLDALPAETRAALDVLREETEAGA